MKPSKSGATRSIASAATASGIAIALLGGLPQEVRAQDAEPAVSLEVIVVTAQRREESLQQVPISISALSSDQLAAANIAESADLERVTPNIIFGESGRDGQIFIRGVGSTRLSGAGADPSSSTYIDGVYRSRGTSSLIEMLDVQRVEVLRGPQGTLYGRNSTGGAVRYISEDPGSQFGGQMTAEIGNYEHRKYTARVDVPVTDTLAVQVAFLHSQRDGYTENLQNPGETFGRKDLNAGRLTVKYTPTDDFDLTLHAGKSKDDSDQTALKHYIDPLGPFGSAEVIKDPRKVRADYSPREAPVDSWYADMTANWNVGSVVLTSITGYVSLDTGPFNGDLDTTEIVGVMDGRDGLPVGIEDGADTFTQEINIASTGDTPFQWVTGAFYLKDDTYTLRQGLYVALIPALAANHRTVDAFGTTTNYSVFANGSYRFNDHFRLNAGIRYSDEKKEVERAQRVNLALAGAPQFDEQSWEDWTPKVGLDYIVNDDAMLYVSYSKGFKSGAFNASNFDPAVNPEYLDAYELGAKTRWLDGALTLNAAAFWYDYTDLQVQSLDPDNIGTEIVRNAAGAEITGAEIEATWLATRSLVVTANAAWLDATYTDFPTLAGNLRGNELPNAPRWTANLGLQYSVDLRNAGELRLSGNYFASAERFLSETNDPVSSRQGAYEMLDARVAWVSGDERWTVSAYGKNLTDEVVFSRTITQPALMRTGYLAYIEPPRTYGLNVAVRF